MRKTRELKADVVVSVDHVWPLEVVRYFEEHFPEVNPNDFFRALKETTEEQRRRLFSLLN